MERETCKLLELWETSRESILPKNLFGRHFSDTSKGEPGKRATLFWGKAAHATYQVYEKTEPRSNLVLVISPGSTRPASRKADSLFLAGEHPLPGAGSFRAGQALLDFFDELGQRRIKHLDVFLSGGASSLAWVLPPGFDQTALLKKLQTLYSEPLTIEALNQARAKLCRLKGGGAFRELQKRSRQTQVKVHLISDVAPFGARVVGSGPFWHEKVPHRIYADNSTWIRAIAREAKQMRLPILFQTHSQLGDWQAWVNLVSKLSQSAKRSGLLILGGEPQMRLPKNSRGKGGRLTQIAAALLQENFPLIQSGRLEILCASSDGTDGLSHASGVLLHANVTREIEMHTSLYSFAQSQLDTAMNQFNTAPLLEKFHALVPAHSPETNVQDVIIAHLR